MAVLRVQEKIKQADGTYNTVHKETEAGLVLFDDNKTFQQKYDAGELTGPAGANGTNGAAAGFGTPKATIDANTGTPSVTVTASGSNTAKVFSFAFKNLKGATGQRGAQWLMGTLLSGTSSTTGAYSSASMPASLVGDMYLNTTYGYIYQCTTAGTGSTAKWTYKGRFPFLPLAGGTVTGNLRIDSGDTDTVHKLNLGDGEYVYISEPEDDRMEIHSAQLRFTGMTEASPNPLPVNQGGTGKTTALTAADIQAGIFPTTGIYAATGTDYTTARVRNVAFKSSDPGAGSPLSSGNILLVYE